jgi:hypothetical protein
MTATNAEIEAEMKLRAFGESISAIYKSEIPSAPSPASMPEVLATDVVKYDIRCIKEKDSILLKIKDNITNRDYRITIQGKDNDIGWSSFKKYYQNDFEKFYQSLELCIEGNTNGLTCNIIEAQNEVIMEIKSSIGLFIWHYSHQIVVPIEENEDEVLKGKNEELKALMASMNMEQLNGIMEEVGETKKEEAKNAKETEKQNRVKFWVEKFKTEKMKVEELRNKLATAYVKEEMRNEVNEKKKGKGKVKAKACGCKARKCFANKKLQYEGAVKGKAYNDFKPCSGKAVNNGYCEKHAGEAEGMKYGNTKDGTYGEPFSFPYHTLPHQKEWVKMIYTLHPEIKPAEEKEGLKTYEIFEGFGKVPTAEQVEKNRQAYNKFVSGRK